MQNATDVKILDAVCSFEPVAFRAPLKFGGRIVDKSILINVEVTVETHSGKHATGFGSMPVGNIWAWPTSQLTGDQTELAMKEFSERLAALASEIPHYGHPLELMFDLAAEYPHLAKTIVATHKFNDEFPALAQLVAASPLDAAVHDAYGRVHKLNSYDTLSSEFMNDDLSDYLDEQFAGEYLDQYTLRKPKDRLPLYHLVGALDPLTDADVTDRPDDRLPVTLVEWINADGLTHLKLKLSGDNFDWDVDRVVSVENLAAEVQAARGCSEWFYSLDFNEKCENVEYVLAFLKKVQEQSPAAYDRIQYIEQPTSRDLKAHPEIKLHEAARLKPVVVDEALISYEALLLARDQGYTGVALKACKGHSEALCLGAAAQKFGMFLCVQDLTCTGSSFLHSASLAARIPTVTAIEGNGRQYCPGPNRPYLRLVPSMFNITDGTVGTGCLDDLGLGF
ncbi:MAG: mandelate racemase/muconate lactonizing enzyme family protein [Planctomycetota bacterium]|nr:mandelate racemase/muconate lactonizing enzyme family protein [Planctomycetota bacterium]MDA1163533.1 mandelate racemase/muconate lactonizing enzyme family protein [Planctomycetota bacterium]